MKMNKLKKFPVVQLMPHNMLQEIEVEVEIVVIMMPIWVIDYYKGGQAEVEAILHHQAQQAVLKLLQRVKNLDF